MLFFNTDFQCLKGVYPQNVSEGYSEPFKIELSPSEKFYVNCFIESPLKMMKNAFYFILKALFVLKIYKFLSRLFGHVEKTA